MATIASPKSLAFVQDRVIPTFENLFKPQPEIVNRIAESMGNNGGYDLNFPVIIGFWDGNEQGVLVDGHTRLAAAIQSGQEGIWVSNKQFLSEEDAVIWAYRNQRDRRNLTPDELLDLVAYLDEKKTKGGDHKSTEFEKSKTSREVIDSDNDSAEIPKDAPSDHEGASAIETARKIGTSRSQVERARAVNSDPEVRAEVKAKKISLAKGAAKVAAKKRLEKVAKEFPPSLVPYDGDEPWIAFYWWPHKREDWDAFEDLKPKDGKCNVALIQDPMAENDSWIDRFFEVCVENPGWTFIFESDRFKRIMEVSESRSYPDNVWVGLVVHNDQEAEEAQTEFARCNAAFRYVVAEFNSNSKISAQMWPYDWAVVRAAPGSRATWKQVIEVVAELTFNRVPVFQMPNARLYAVDLPGQKTGGLSGV